MGNDWVVVWCVQRNGKAHRGLIPHRTPMKCIYCEENETKGALLCYGCQVDLFPLVSPWVYCGVCGNELATTTMICPRCAQAGNVSAPSISLPTPPPSTLQSPPAKQPMALAPLPKEPPVTREEIKRARRFQWLIKSLLVLFWAGVFIFIVLWARDYINQPVDDFLP